MGNATEKTYPLGQNGLIIETEQDPASANSKALTNASDSSLKHAVNVDFRGMPNLRRRLGYSDLFHDPSDGTRITHKAFNDAGTFAVTDKQYQTILDNQRGVRGLFFYVYMDYKYLTGSSQFDRKKYTLFALQDNPTFYSQNPINSVPESHTYLYARNLGGGTGDYVGQLEAPLLDRSIYNNSFSDVNIRGMQRSRFWNYATWTRGSQNDSYILGTYGGHHTRPGTPTAPAAWLTEVPNVASAIIAPPPGSFDAPSIDANCYQRRVMFWNPEWYHEWARINGYVNIRLDLSVNVMVAGPLAGNGIVGSNSGATMFVTSWDLAGEAIFGYRTSVQDFEPGEPVTEYVIAGPIQMNPAAPNLNATPIVYPCAEINVGYWQAPFIWYHKPYDANRNLELQFFILSTPPPVGAILTQAVTLASMSVTDVVVDDTVTLHLLSITTAPAIGSTIEQATSGAKLTVTSVNLTNNTITGTDQNTGAWFNYVYTVSGGGLLPSPGTVISNETVPDSVFGVDLETGDWAATTSVVNAVSDSTATMDPDPAWVIKATLTNWDEFYAEPCGRFLETFQNSLFMARIERTYLFGSGYQQAGTPRHIYEPSAIMWSFWGLATGMELGTPPVYPFNIPSEPSERVWGCQAYGFPCNRLLYFRKNDQTFITGMAQWNNSLYVFKPTGFGQITGLFSGDFGLTDLQMSQGPCGPKAWAKADEGIYYCTRKGFYLFDGNSASQNVALSDGKVSKIFRDDIDWMSTTDSFSGEIIGLSTAWDKNNAQVLISYPKKGEQGGDTGLPTGTPTRMLVYDILGGRFTEWDIPLPIDAGNTHSPAFGLMGQDYLPTDENYMIGTDPIGNDRITPNDGRILFHINFGHRDNVEIDANNLPDANTGDRIVYDVTTKDFNLGELKHKEACVKHRTTIYANNGNVKTKVIYNYYDAQDEGDLIFQPTGEDGFVQSIPMEHQSTLTASALVNANKFAVISFKFHHDDPIHMVRMITLLAVTGSPAVGDVLTQLNTGATLQVTNSLLTGTTLQVWGLDLNTGVWDAVAANTVTGGTLLPAARVPSAVSALMLNPINTNIPDHDIEFVAHSFDVEQGGDGRT